ncbi:MAG TPA: hypothetical protein VK900_18965 [Anaerolineales bacterium]|nr:hypothetical protein [Anaerolineales bacterium]
MLNLRSSYRSFHLPDIAVPIVILAMLILAFGLVISALGIYQDDWIFVYNAFVHGPQGLREFLNADGTPFSSFMNIVLFNLLGVKPLYWHMAALIARWLTVVAFWMILRQLWPANPLQNFFVALLFAVYPFFTLQPLAFTFLHVWIGYFLLGLSIYWMVLAAKRPEKFWLYLILSLVAGILTHLTLEYFMGWEFVRPVILWLALQDRPLDIGQRWIEVGKRWVPYLVIFALYVWWRFFIYQVPVENRNDPIGLKLLFSDPLAELSIILANIFPDSLSIMLTGWYKALDPLFFHLTDRTDLLFVLLSIFAGLTIFFALDRYTERRDETRQNDVIWKYQALGLGVMILVLGLIPPYVAGLFINEKNPLWNSRFGLASMPGAALITVAVLELISPQVRTRLVLIAVLIGLAVGYHARYTNDFRWAWRKEVNLYRQLKLRVPALQAGTAVVAEGEILTYMGDYPTAYALNTIYAEPLSDENVDTWFFAMTSNFAGTLDAFLDGMDIQGFHRNVTFTGRSDNILVVSFEPASGQCLYVIRPQDASFRKLPPLLREASQLSAVNRIDVSASPGSPFLQAIELDYPDDWCTYYQKADLARQKEDYEEVAALWQQARDKGFSPDAYFEYMPFIDAFVQLGGWEDAVKLTLDVRRRFPISRLTSCDYWHSLPASPERDSALEKLEAKLDCSSGE